MFSTTTVVISLLFLVYFSVLFIELWQYSRPLKSCVQPTSSTRTSKSSPQEYACFYPLVQPNDQLHLELWTFVDSGNAQCTDNADSCPRSEGEGHTQWEKVQTCREIPVSLSEPSKTFKNTNCTILIPNQSRRRGHESGHPLHAVFILKRGDTVVAEAPFELTRMVKKTYKSKVEASEKHSGDNRNQVVMVPHYKYLKQHVVLRLVQEYRLYTPNLTRGDGLRLQRHVGSCGNSHLGSTQYCYRPILYVDDTALLHASHVELAPPNTMRNVSSELRLNLKVSLVSPLRDVIIRHITEGMKLVEYIFREEELDEIRWFLSDENVYRFLLTQIISLIHLTLDFAAFRDEVNFYVGRKDMGGLSISSVITRFLCSLIIFLYLYDQRRTSFLVLFSVFLGVVADGWKAVKVLKPTFSTTRFPFIHFRDPSNLSLVETNTAKYDSIARTYLGLIFYPVILGTAFYARRHYHYDNHWSWIISHAANAVYTFGFIALCPQLYINYRLKSVAHLPWKVFVYKIFNTFIDDVFAFMIEMRKCYVVSTAGSPDHDIINNIVFTLLSSRLLCIFIYTNFHAQALKHKLMTLRDDAIFLGFLIQCYFYRVDKSRCNEFGYAYETDTATCCAESESDAKVTQRSDDEFDCSILLVEDRKMTTELTEVE